MKLAVYLHVACMNHWREIAVDLTARVEASGLYDAASDLTLCLVGDGAIGPDLLEERWMVMATGLDVSAYEYPTLDRLWRDCCRDPERMVLYMHTKGVSFKARKIARDQWRRYMAYFAITRWRECVEILTQGIEAVGTERICHKHRYEDFYAGNFWWARGDYIAGLDQPVANTRMGHPRFWAEMWVLSGGALNFNWALVEDQHWKRFQVKEKQYRNIPRPPILLPP